MSGKPKSEKNKIHLSIISNRYGSIYGCLRTSYRDKTGRPCNKTLYTFKNSTLEQLTALKAVLEGKETVKTGETISIENVRSSDSREYGASKALFELARQIGLTEDIYSKLEDWVRDVLAMIIGRIIYQGSKLYLSKVTNKSALWEICGFNTRDIDVEKHCYEPMDRLLKRQKAIEKNFAKRNLAGHVAILYDITSSYFEGEYKECESINYGYNRDKKKGKKQIVIGLICTKNGCPISVEVFPGNTKDVTTVESKIKEMRDSYGITDTVFVGDRGMITTSNYDSFDAIKTISGLTHSDLNDLLNKGVELTLFDEKMNVEWVFPNEPNVRYALMKNPKRALEEDEELNRLLDKTEKELKSVSEYKRKASDAILNQRLGKAKNKYRVGKYFDCNAENGVVKYSRKVVKIAEDTRLHGLYALRTNVSKEAMDIDEVVEAYRDLSNVEYAFRTMKTTELEMRPMYHKNEERIKAHVFICMLSYYLFWHMRQRLQSLFEADGKGKNRSVTFDNIIDTLKCIRMEKLSIFDNIVYRTTVPTEEQQSIIGLLGVEL
jgi:transposase